LRIAPCLARCRSTLRDHVIAAPLKRLGETRNRKPIRCSPRSRDRGPVEALPNRRKSCPVRDSPRSRDRGPVEASSLRARPARAPSLSPRSRDRGPVEANIGVGIRADSEALRDHVIAAPLKRHTRTPSSTSQRLSAIT